MKVVCPECSTDVEVPNDELGPQGRRVRCSSCRHIWFQEPYVEPVSYGGFRRFDESLDIEPIPISVHPDVEVEDDEDAESGPSFLKSIDFAYLARMIAGFVLGFIVVGSLLAGGATAGVMPKVFARFYAAFGVAVPMDAALVIKDVKVVETKNGDETLTSVSGWIVNNADEDKAIPALDIAPLDANGNEDEGIRIKPEQESLKPQEGLEFKADLQGPPPEGGNIRIRFAR